MATVSAQAFDKDSAELDRLMDEIGQLAEDMQETTSRSMVWYMLSIELQKSCLQLRAVRERAEENARRIVPARSGPKAELNPRNANFKLRARSRRNSAPAN